MGFSGNVVDKGIKLIGNLVKKSSELTGTFIGILKEKIFKQPGEKDKFSTKGRITGRVLKRDIDKVGEKSAVIVDKGVEVIGKYIRKAIIIFLKGLNQAAKTTYEGTEKLKNSFYEYNKSKEKVNNKNNKDKKINDMDMTIVESEKIKEFIHINKNHNEYESATCC
ncbi:hypothetical protein [Clostridium tarantellae]|uniref:Uncharacterized protein n=1 Tax=Clostridium tarantellae TaxID=39493 RepID=A0A6I1MKS0_9CLOT|nr:hypothetical protein [Clostridium tarantellae]MPQ43620.1 hypothetical protein [Clostridium tarantellae]